MKNDRKQLAKAIYDDLDRIMVDLETLSRHLGEDIMETEKDSLKEEEVQFWMDSVDNVECSLQEALDVLGDMEKLA